MMSRTPWISAWLAAALLAAATAPGAHAQQAAAQAAAPTATAPLATAPPDRLPLPSLRVVEASAAGVTYEVVARWDGPLSASVHPGAFVTVQDAARGLPALGERVELPSLAPPTVTVLAAEFDEVALPFSAEAAEATGLVGPAADVERIGLERRRPVGTVVARLLQADPEAGVLRRYRRLRVRVQFPAAQRPARPSSSPGFALRGGEDNPHLTVDRSVLAEGTWFKVPIAREGVYRLDRAFLAAIGAGPDGVDPDRVRVYGNGGAPLPALNEAPRTPDLGEIPTFVTGGGDGRFDDGDAVYFFANAADGWTWDESIGDEPYRWRHYINPFSRVNYVFVRVDGAAGRRVGAGSFPGGSATVLSEITGRLFVEEDLPEGMIDRDSGGSGLDWLGPDLNRTTTRITALDTLPNGLAAGTVRYRSRVAARTPTSVRLAFLDGAEELDETPAMRNLGGNLLFDVEEMQFEDAAQPGQPLSLTLELRPGAATSPIGWLDYVEAFYPKALRATDGYLRFHTPGTADGLTELVLGGFASEPQVWDVTDPHGVRRLGVQSSGGDWRVRVTAEADAPRELVAFVTGSPRLLRLDDAVPEGADLEGLRLENQNLHGVGAVPDYLIVAAAPFRAAADDLAEHRRADGLSPLVVGIDQVYNEFAGGLTDPRGLRDYIRFLYDRAARPDGAPVLEHVLLFGDGHYDYRGIKDGGDENNWVPTYQTENSRDDKRSFTSDDYFALLDPGEGLWRGNAERIDVGIGRFPVRTPEGAAAVVRKVKRYEDPATLGDWRTRYTLLADDHRPNSWDTDLHIDNAEDLDGLVEELAPDLNVQKIYTATYPLEQTALGARYPGATQDVIRGFGEGTLLWNYSGHGGAGALADEKLITRDQIRVLDNFDRLAILITATCSFGRYDLVDAQSAGEEFVLNADGGAVAIFTTSRVVFTGTDTTSANLGMNVALNRFLLRPGADGRPRRLGEAYRLAKGIDAGAQFNNRKFNLLGDPAMRIGLPERDVRITAVNGTDIGGGDGVPAATPVLEGEAQGSGLPGLPELRALELARIEGEVLRPDGERDAGFDGEVEVTVFDVERDLVLPPEVPIRYTGDGIYDQRVDLLYRGRASVRDGRWDAEFVVPRDVSYAGEPGRISAYVSTGGGLDGQGFTEDVLIATTAGAPLNDTEGPEVRLFLDDTTFVAGGLVGEEPVLIARLADENGINAAGTGVGHELLLTVDGAQGESVNLGGFYRSDLDTYQRGEVRYTLPELAPGPHTLTLTAWDVANNPTTATLDFVVAESDRLTVRNAYPYPNPTTGPTRFVFEHNQPPGTPARVQVRVYTLSGRPVRTLDGVETLPDGTLAGPLVQIPWDGRDEDLDGLATGVYLYKLRVEVDRGEGERLVTEQIERLAVIR